MNSITHQNKAYILALLAVLFWSTMSSAFKITLRFIDFDELLLWSSLFGATTLFIINQFGRAPIRFKNLSWADIKSSALMGFFNPFLYYLILFKAYELLDAQMAGTLNYTWPIVLVILSVIFLKQRISAYSFVAIFVSFIGIVIISTQGNIFSIEGSNILGVILAVGSSIIWSIYWILNMKDSREETNKIFLNLSFGFIYILIYLLITSNDFTIPTGYAILGSIYIGIFEMSLTFVIWLLALKNSSNTAKVSNLIFLSPFIALLIINITIGEKILSSTIIGLIFIIGGIVIQRFSNGKLQSNDS